MKPHAFTQLYVQLVFSVAGRETILSKSIRPRIFEYLSGIIKGLKHKSIIVNGFTDHLHILIGLNPSVSISETVYTVKRSSSLFINENKLLPGHFSWQEGYGAFSYSKSDLDVIYNYIMNQEQHHQKKSFREEYMSLLEKNDIDYDPRFLFEFYDSIV